MITFNIVMIQPDMSTTLFILTHHASSIFLIFFLDYCLLNNPFFPINDLMYVQQQLSPLNGTWTFMLWPLL